MPTCEVCGNEYDKTFNVSLTNDPTLHVFDSFECAIQALAPSCAHCGCTILGHGVEANAMIYCCAHCAAASGVDALRDRADAVPEKEASPSHRARGGAGGARRSRRATPAERRSIGISRQSGDAELQDQRSLPERGQGRE